MIKPLEPEMLLCPVHAEPFRHIWPEGFTIFINELISEVLTSPAFVREIRNDVDNTHEALARKPICCRASPAQLLDAYQAANIGTLAKCRNCLQTKFGCSYAVVNHWNRVKRYPHLCFDCISKLPAPKLKAPTDTGD